MLKLKNNIDLLFNKMVLSKITNFLKVNIITSARTKLLSLLFANIWVGSMEIFFFAKLFWLQLFLVATAFLLLLTCITKADLVILVLAFASAFLIYNQSYFGSPGIKTTSFNKAFCLICFDILQKT